MTEMNRYRIEYRDAGDSGCPIFKGIYRGYTAEHARERFWEADEDDGWEIISITLIK